MRAAAPWDRARSLLFVPGDRPERFARAQASGAGAVILDLEDAVAPQHKAAARDAVAGALDAAQPVLLRINAAGTPWFADDARLAAHPGVAAVMLPKAGQVDEIAALAAQGIGSVIALVETAAGIDNVKAVAAAGAVRRLAFGAIDFQLDLGITGERDELLAFRSALVLASRLAGLPRPVDGVSTALDDAAALQADAAYARRLGFGGKLCIHPRQVAVVDAAFAPAPAELAWAQRVLEAARSAGGAAVAVDGKMVDRPVMLRAQSILEEAGPAPGTEEAP